MTARKAPPEIFDNRLLRLRRERASRRGDSFIAQRCAEDLAERLQDINRQFQKALIIGSQDFLFALKAALPPEKMPVNIAHRPFADLNAIAAPEAPIFGEGEYDLIVSALYLQAMNDLPGTLIQTRLALKPDGLFIGAMFGGETLTELRGALYTADEAAYGGISPRVYPFADYSQAAQLLQRGGFALPVVDSDRFQVHYKNWRTLISDIRDMGGTNSLAENKSKRFPLEKANQAIAALSRDGKFSVSFEILWLTAWCPHSSQQKPLAPGSAKMRLADALGTQEEKLPKTD